MTRQSMAGEALMGQYYYVVNLDKKQFLHPHKFGDGLKLLEFGSSGSGTMCALALLLANSQGGGGSMNTNRNEFGSWAGDRIVIAGDYGLNDGELYRQCSEGEYADVSESTLAVMLADSYLAEDLTKAAAQWDGGPLSLSLGKAAAIRDIAELETEIRRRESNGLRRVGGVL